MIQECLKTFFSHGGLPCPSSVSDDHKANPTGINDKRIYKLLKMTFNPLHIHELAEAKLTRQQAGRLNSVINDDFTRWYPVPAHKINILGVGDAD